jgi:MFS transporter, AAHS family, 4-hydroxybenzoate transporter
MPATTIKEGDRMSGRTVGISAAIDAAPFGRIQLFVVMLCASIALLEGFDTQVIAFVVPVVAGKWGVPVSSFGKVFGAGLAGLMIGALSLGPIADRVGRKTVIVASIFSFGLFSLTTAFAGSISALILLRFLTGLGIGGTMPNIIALTAEYAPTRLRAMTVSVMFCGFPLGGALGGAVAARIIPRFGWPSIFLLGGILPLLLAPVLGAFLPESLRFLSARAHLRDRGERILRSLLGEQRAADVDMNAEVASASATLPLRGLFTEGRAGATLLLWAACFSNLMMMYFMVNWLPTLLKQAGIPLEKAMMSAAVLNLGGVIGAIVLARAIDRWRPGPILALVYVVTVICTCAIGHMTQTPFAVLMTIVFIVGFCLIGGQMSLNVLAADLYPTSMRATGVGWALGFGRIGSIFGPMAGGLLIAWGLDVASLFTALAIPGFVAAASVWQLGASRLVDASRALARTT